MLAEHAADASTFTPGGAAADRGTAGTGGTVPAEGGVGGVAGLPNGLSHEVFGYLPYWALSSGHMLSTSTTTSSRRSRTSRSVPGRTERSRRRPAERRRPGWAGWTSAAMTNVIASRPSARRQGRADRHDDGVGRRLSRLHHAARQHDEPGSARAPDRGRRSRRATPTASTSTSSRCRTRSSRTTRDSSAR